jgi:hypothetical protein
MAPPGQQLAVAVSLSEMKANFAFSANENVFDETLVQADRSETP